MMLFSSITTGMYTKELQYTFWDRLTLMFIEVCSIVVKNFQINQASINRWKGKENVVPMLNAILALKKKKF